MHCYGLYIPSYPALDYGMHGGNRVHPTPSNPHNPYATHTGHPRAFRMEGVMQSQTPYYTSL
ncbi:acyl-CoA dehydrogenase [Aeropyrum pernix]|uniref:Acyl-CoA dehydrogenase n=1 Tax=Aeropyrum pernix TaxID=56636 RepID=A0A401H8M1_AERPX|nr:acyl-CoA dehydrogenase [Aeropyrum pernix]